MVQHPPTYEIDIDAEGRFRDLRRDPAPSKG